MQRKSEILVQIQHDSLFAQVGEQSKSGEAIAYMLGGYCETVLNGILRDVSVEISQHDVQISPKNASYLFVRAGLSH